MFARRLLAVAAIVAMIVVALGLPVLKPPTDVSAQQLLSPYSLDLSSGKDAWVNQQLPTTNYGTDAQLDVGRVTSGGSYFNRETLVWFDLTPLPAAATIVNATLRLYQVQASGATNYSVFPDAAMTAWDESTVTWNTKPSAGNLGDAAVSLDTTNGWKSWDVTQILSNWKAGKIQNYGIRLRGDNLTLGLRVFGSREDSTHQPVITIVYTLPAGCTEILSPQTIPSPGLITFDDLADGTAIGTYYQPSRGVSFEDTSATKATSVSDTLKAKSPPNVAINQPVSPFTSSNVPMRISFDTPKTHVGFWIGNGDAAGLAATLSAYDTDGTAICTVTNAPVPNVYSEFIGVYDQYGRIARVALSYGATTIPEGIDDLYYAPKGGEAVQPTISNILPSGWVTRTKTPSVYANAIDIGSGLNVSSGSYRYSTNGGATWSAPQAASVSGADGVTTMQVMTATNVAFNQDSATQNVIELSIADMNGNVGTAQKTIQIDTTRPTAPTAISSSDHTIAVWSDDNTIALTWSGATDATSGVEGYSVLFDHSPTTLPDPTLDVFAASYTSLPLADGVDWYAHVRTTDWADNWSPTAIHLGPFKIDTVPPSNPTAVTSADHTVGVWSDDPTIWMGWYGASDGDSGVFGYSFVWDTSPDTLPDTLFDTGGTNTTSPVLADGDSHYFHLRTRDVAGNWSATAVHEGPFKIDVTAPSSAVTSPSGSVSNAIFLVSWAGLDGGSGLANYDIQYRDMTTGGSWTSWLNATTATAQWFFGTGGHTYQFRSRARDNLGNLEDWPASRDREVIVATEDFALDTTGALEVTQGVQDRNNSVLLVADKPTFVRFHVHSNTGSETIGARLAVWRGAQFLGYVLPGNPAGKVNVKSDPDRGELEDSFWFQIPSQWLHDTITLKAEANYDHHLAEYDYLNNVATTSVFFNYVPPMDLALIDMCYSWNGSDQYVPWVDREAILIHLKRLYPISKFNVTQSVFANCYDDVPSILETVLPDVIAMKQFDILFNGSNPSQRYYGMVNDAYWRFYDKKKEGWSPVPSVAAVGTVGENAAGNWIYDARYSGWTAGHELGHAYGLPHAPCGLNPDDPGNPDYPYPNAVISPSQDEDAANAIYGFDIQYTKVITPGRYDFMAYCKPRWISDYSYEWLYDRHIAEKLIWGSAPRAVQSTGEYLAVYGSIVPDDQVTLDRFYRVPNAWEVPERITGTFSIRLMNAGGSSLADYPFTPRLNGGSDGTAKFSLINEFVPWVTGTARIAIYHQGQEVASRIVSPNAPLVAVISPNGGESLSGPTATINWSASDPDGDPLVFMLQYSTDGGAKWQALAANVTGNSLAINTSLLAGTTQGRIRIMATDGVNTGYDDSSGNFSVPRKAPDLHLITQTGGPWYIFGQTVAFEADAYDVEDGPLADASFTWSSNLQGTLGTGHSIAVADLVTGTHQITVTVTDSDGQQAQANTKVFVDVPAYRLYLPVVASSVGGLVR